MKENTEITVVRNDMFTEDRTEIKSLIYVIRGRQIMLDSDLAMLYQVETTAFHNRFLLIDEKDGYYIGASIKDAGKKCFAINGIEDVGVINDLIQRAQITSAP